MDEELKVDEQLKDVTKWSDYVEITIPLSKYLKKIKKIEKLKRKVKEENDKYWEQWRRANEAEKALDNLKADYQKLLGIKKEEGKQE